MQWWFQVVRPMGCFMSIGALWSLEWWQARGQGGKDMEAGRAIIILLSHPDCLGQKYIPFKVYLAFSCPSYLMGREGALCSVQTILRLDEKQVYRVTKSRLQLKDSYSNSRSLTGFMTLSLRYVIYIYTYMCIYIYIYIYIYNLYCYSVTKSCPTLCDPMNCSTQAFPALYCLPGFAQTHVHWVSDAIQPSHPLSSPSPLTLNPSQH